MEIGLGLARLPTPGRSEQSFEKQALNFLPSSTPEIGSRIHRFVTRYIRVYKFLDTKKINSGNNLSMNREDHTWMEKALAAASQCLGDVPVGCLVVKDGAILGSGFNQREQLQDPTAHAEILAIREAARALGSWRLDGCTLYATLEPCAMCAEAIIQARMARVVFGAYEAQTGACGSRFNLFEPGRSLPIPEVLGGICEEECRALIQEFFRLKR